MTTQIKINYKEYPEFMFAIIASYLPAYEGDDIRRLAGKVEFRHEDIYNNTCKNGLLHSFDDKPAVSSQNVEKWFKDGLIHREGDLPAIISKTNQEWYKNNMRHRDNGLPAFIGLYNQE